MSRPRPIRATCYVQPDDESRSRRGPIVFDAQSCIACGVCSAVCGPGALVLDESGSDFTWSYTPAACTFCKLCVRACPSAALTQEAERPSAGALAAMPSRVGAVTIPPCPACGAPYMLPSADVVRFLYGEGSVSAVSAVASLDVCPACRRRRAATVHEHS